VKRIVVVMHVCLFDETGKYAAGVGDATQPLIK